jgi:hypothetical protein
MKNLLGRFIVYKLKDPETTKLSFIGYREDGPVWINGPEIHFFFPRTESDKRMSFHVSLPTDKQPRFSGYEVVFEE